MVDLHPGEPFEGPEVVKFSDFRAIIFLSDSNLPQSELPLWAWTNGKLGQSFIRSILYAGLGAAFAITLASLAAYALVQFRPKGTFYDHRI